jgi:hypothetical protein
MTARSALMQDESASYFGRGSSRSKAHQFMRGEAISAPTGLHCKGRSFTLQRQTAFQLHTVSVRERSSGNGIQQRRRH